MSVTRTSHGWVVVSPLGRDEVADLLEGLSLADLVAEQLGLIPEPDRTARRSARGHSTDAPEPGDGTDPRIAALERTVAQLEHALAGRVATERAIGVLAERHGTGPRTAFEALRREARSQGRPVSELAREVLAELPDDSPDEQAPSPTGRHGRSAERRHPSPVAVVPARDAGSPVRRTAAVAAGPLVDGRS